MITRKQFLSATAVTAASILTNRWAIADPFLSTAQGVPVTVDPGTKLNTISSQMAGLSFESRRLQNPESLSGGNSSLIGLCRLLGKTGVIRIGGNSSEFADWMPSLVSGGQPITMRTTTIGKKVTPHTPITQQSLTNLSDFLSATGWKLIYGFNLGTGSPEAAADQAKFISRVMGDKLIAFQIGNEPDCYHMNGLRPYTYEYPQFIKEWTQFADAIEASCPGAPLAGPDIASTTDWVKQFSRDVGSRVVLLTGHHYPLGEATTPAADIKTLLGQDGILGLEVTGEMAAMRQSGLPFRVSETNSSWHPHGLPGVSDTFASALWCADFSLQMVSDGMSGLNCHTIPQGTFTPIADDPSGFSSTRPMYFGMLFARFFADSTLLKTTVPYSAPGLTAYGAIKGKKQLVGVINRGLISPRTIQLSTGTKSSTARMLRLSAPSIDATSGVTFGGSQVGSDGSWMPTFTPVPASSPGKFTFDLPAASGALVFVEL